MLVEESIAGWKEFELEVMRDRKDNVVIICSIENLDPMGVHTGDSITVAPAQTLTDKEYQIMRDAAVAIIREIGVETGGSNVQFAVDPTNGPSGRHRDEPARLAQLGAGLQGDRVSRSRRSPPSSRSATRSTRSATTSRARRRRASSRRSTTSSRRSRASPSRSSPAANDELTSQMKSVGEAMAIGRTFKESLQKALRSLEIGSAGFEPRASASRAELDEKLVAAERGSPLVRRRGVSARLLTSSSVFELSKIDPWFLENIRQIIEMEGRSSRRGGFERARPADELATRQTLGLFRQATRRRCSARARRRCATGAVATASCRCYKTVDTCAAEFEAYTPYLYSTYESEDEAQPTEREEDHHPRRRAEPDRPGHRVRLLLRARRPSR